MNRQNAFINEYQRLHKVQYGVARMVWVKAVLEGNRELINMYLNQRERHTARMKVVA